VYILSFFLKAFYERVIVDYYGLKGYIVESGVLLPEKKDIDVIAYLPYSQELIVCEVYGDVVKEDQELYENMVQPLTNPDMEKYVKEKYGVESFKKQFICKEIHDVIKDIAEKTAEKYGIEIIELKDIFIETVGMIKGNIISMKEAWYQPRNYLELVVSSLYGLKILTTVDLLEHYIIIQEGEEIDGVRELYKAGETKTYDYILKYSYYTPTKTGKIEARVYKEERYKKPRRVITIVVDGEPRKDFVATDNYDKTGELVARIKIGNEFIKEKEKIPERIRKNFKVVNHKEYIEDGFEHFAILLRNNEITKMIHYTLLEKEL